MGEKEDASFLFLSRYKMKKTYPFGYNKSEMQKIIILEDEEEDRNRLLNYLNRYQEEQKTSFSIQAFSEPISFLSSYRGHADIVFFDIEMPHLNGMEAAKKLREVDKDVLLVFITNLASYAIQGYSVQATDFLLKPVSYPVFSMMMDKLLALLAKRKNHEILVKTQDKVVTLSSDDIEYLEISNHYVIFHTEEGDLSVFGSLKEYAASLPKDFVFCHSSYLVNLRYVKAVEGNVVLVAKDRLEISKKRKKEFLNALSAYIGEK